MDRRSVLMSGLAAAVVGSTLVMAGCNRQQATAPKQKTTVNLGMVLEPPGLDPTAGAASAIGEITLYNVYETLTKVAQDGSVQPLLAQSWQASADQKVWTFKLRTDAKFHNGEPFNAETVKFAFERAAAEGSTNKDKTRFQGLERIETPDATTVVLHSRTPNPDLPFLLGLATAAIVEPKSAATNATQPVGTGPFVFDNWQKGAAVTLKKWEGYREASKIAMTQATFRFISDAAAQAAALLSGDLDVFMRVQVARSLDQFKNDQRFNVQIGASSAKTIVALNNAKAPLNDVRVRQALAYAIDRSAVIAGAADGLGVPIGSYYVPGMPGYIDLTSVHAHNLDKARALLKEADVQNLTLTMKLPPPPYARQGGEVIAAQLAKIGVTVRLENVEWAQWLSQVYGKSDYDMTMISHVEPYDLGNFAKAGYYWNYKSDKFNTLFARINATADVQERNALLGEAQKMVAEEAVGLYLYQPQWVTVHSKQLQGVWQHMPVFANDLASMRWS